MVRQAQTYLASAVSATALVSAAVVAFVLLVSLQALRDWPLAGLGVGGDEAAVAPARSAGAAGAGTLVAGGAGVAASDRAGARDRGGGAPGTGQRDGSAALGASPSPSGVTPVGEAPSTGTGAGDGPGASAPGGSTPSSVGGGNGGAPASQPGGASPGAGSGESTSGALTGAVNETVSGVNETLGGALGDTGVTEVTETTVNGLAGPESTVGKTVDKVVDTVGGVLGGGR